MEKKKYLQLLLNIMCQITAYVVLVAADNRKVDEAGDAERLGSVSLIC